MSTSKDRPGDWNSDVIWLLERLVGLLHSQSKGTGSATLPRGIPSSDVLHYVRLKAPTDASVTDLGAAAEIAVQLPTTTRQWFLRSAQAHRVDGSATTWALAVGQVAGFVVGGPDDRAAFASQAFTTAFRKVFCSPLPLKTDATGKVYIKPQLDAGADNDIDLQLWFEQAFETEESS